LMRRIEPPQSRASLLPMCCWAPRALRPTSWRSQSAPTHCGGDKGKGNHCGDTGGDSGPPRPDHSAPIKLLHALSGPKKNQMTPCMHT
jgi:hypothetical protein